MVSNAEAAASGTGGRAPETTGKLAKIEALRRNAATRAAATRNAADRRLGRELDELLGLRELPATSAVMRARIQLENARRLLEAAVVNGGDEHGEIGLAAMHAAQAIERLKRVRRNDPRLRGVVRLEPPRPVTSLEGVGGVAGEAVGCAIGERPSSAAEGGAA